MTDFFINRPIFTIASFLLLLFAGLFAYKKLDVREYPNMSGDTIMVLTTYPGANASTMASMVTSQLENALQGIDGVDYITSTSSSGTSKIMIYLDIGTDETATVTDIEKALSSVESLLPNGVNNPVIRDAAASSLPDFILSYTSEKMSAGAVTAYITTVINPVISNLPGVGELQIMGDREYAMRIWLDAYKMRAYGITATDISDALSEENVQATPGDINRKNQVIIINAQTDEHDASDFQNIILKEVNGKLIYLQDVATISLGAKDNTTSMFTEGKSAVGLAITYKNSANALTTAKLIQKTIDNLKLPKDLSVQVIRDGSGYIKASIKEVLLTLCITLITIFLIIILFLGSLRFSLIPLLTIPLSLIGNFILMYAFGFSINLLTLLAFVLAIGLVVDDAIVVMENTHRHIVSGMPSIKSAKIGVRELVVAIVGITLTLLAVFAPIGLEGGITGALFTEFAFTLAGAVLISGFVALFFTPMICSKVLTKNSSKFGNIIENFLLKLANNYGAFLEKIIHQKRLILLIICFIIVLGGVSLKFLYDKSELAPSEDQGMIVGMSMSPTSASIDYTQRYTNKLAPIFNQYSSIENSSIVNGFPSGQYSSMVMVKLIDWDNRDESANQLVRTLMPKVGNIPGINIMLNSPPALPISKGIYNFQFVVKTFEDYSSLSKVITKITSEAQTNSNIANLQVDLHIDQPEVIVSIDKQKANYLGISMSDIAQSLSVAFGQPQSNEFTLNGYSYYVIPQINDDQRSNQDVIDLLIAETTSGSTISLSTVVTLTNEITSAAWNHFQGQKSATISAQLADGYSSEQALTYFKQLANKYMTDEMSYDTAGETRSFIETQGSIRLLFIAALIVIFLVLAAQFESFLDPLIIMLTVPLAITSALLALYFVGYSLNIYTEIGLITLIGLITKHGILLVDFAKKFRKENNASASLAIIQAAKIRFKPVIMTTLAMVFGSLPLLLASGAGASSRNQLGLVITAGMLFGTLFTLLVLPTVYAFAYGFKEKNNHIVKS